ncbi:hypothetical protein ANN_00119 [Periplaneta americana]|uniref:Arginine kinase n=1 Tax=Periplaneta americana TaxID=6978 RepID=A0ABQ8TS97_PERAM|nr:hypothetical protein ANN_00119 [Periplaneta americana]
MAGLCEGGNEPSGSLKAKQRTNIKFCVLIHKTPAETLRLLEEAYGEAAQVYAWHKRFSGGRDSIKDDVRSGRPTTATNEAIAQRVRNVVRDDRRKTIKEIAAKVGISVGSVHNVLHKLLNMHYVSQKLVPKMLSAEQKETRMTLAGDMISMADEDGDFLNKIIAGDETWYYLYDPDTSKGKVMLEVFFDSQGLIHHEFIPEGRTVTKELYVEIFRRLLDAVRRKRPEKWVENNWFLMHDNAPAHRAIIVKNFLAMHNITALDHPPYSPDLSPPDCFLFPRLKSHLKGRRFNAEEVIANATRALRRVSQNGFQPASRNSTRVGKSLENHDSGVGIYAPDAEAYAVFADLFDPIIEDYHGGFKKTDKHPPKDWGDVDTLGNLDPAGEYIISTRVRCGRSMQGYPFNPCLTEAQYKEMEDKVSSTLSGLEAELKGQFYPLTGMTKEVQQKLIDDHFLFKEGDRFLQVLCLI